MSPFMHIFPFATIISIECKVDKSEVYCVLFLKEGQSTTFLGEFKGRAFFDDDFYGCAKKLSYKRE